MKAKVSTDDHSFSSAVTIRLYAPCSYYRLHGTFNALAHIYLTSLTFSRDSQMLRSHKHTHTQLYVHTDLRLIYECT